MSRNIETLAAMRHSTILKVWCLQTAVNLNVQVFRKNIRPDSIYLAFCMIIIITRKVRLRLFGHAPTPLK